ncbi:hypothetical protein AYI69_g10673 [Smittium culicis]|uniref:Uncharacterized protein n=1 Tax=Smittium culicis TaxID=133412 RepID=A0A1R1X4B6_9FUNG|nr:hypothetical protein AYI69_g10673 [Smittium culicis]
MAQLKSELTESKNEKIQKKSYAPRNTNKHENSPIYPQTINSPPSQTVKHLLNDPFASQKYLTNRHNANISDKSFQSGENAFFASKETKDFYASDNSSQALSTRENKNSVLKSTTNSNDPSKNTEYIKSSTLPLARSSTDSTATNKFYRSNNFSNLPSSKPNPTKSFSRSPSTKSKLKPSLSISKSNSIKSKTISIKSQNKPLNRKITPFSEKKNYLSSKSISYSKNSPELSYNNLNQNKSPPATPMPFKRHSKKISIKFPSGSLASTLKKPQSLARDSRTVPDPIDRFNVFPQSHVNNIIPHETFLCSKKHKNQPQKTSKSQKLATSLKKASISSYSIKSDTNPITHEFYLDNGELATSKFDLNFEKDRSLDFNFEFNKNFDLDEQLDFNRCFLCKSQSAGPNESKGGDVIVVQNLDEISSGLKHVVMNDPLRPPLRLPAASPNYSDSSQLSSPTLKEYVVIKKRDTFDYQSSDDLDQGHKTSKILNVFKSTSSTKSEKRSSAPLFNSPLTLKSCRKFSINSSNNNSNKTYRPFSIHNFDFNTRYTRIFPNDQNNNADPTLNDCGYAIIQQVKSS